MKTITLSTLRDILASVRGTTAVSMVTVTDARLKKTGNPYVALGPVYKACKVNGMCNTDHEAACNRAQAKAGEEPNYRAVERSWGVRHGALVEHEGRWYLGIQLRPTSRPNPIYLAPRIVGIKPRLTPITREAIAPYLPPQHEEIVTRRDYRLDSIVQMSINGERYRIRA